ncbi:hypothetical protein Fcan01_09805 [Folsomia candida]|uniref:Uncharacterized protein n=1 Tax=Folsomia candida TaxID=158441 RepID=A0A226EFY9_FOLCA|nr:hypothetical protein Fcan01_09805 [Folsomia candida]
MMLILLTMAKPSIEGANLRELREDSDTDPNDYADVREFQYKEHFSDYEFPEAHKRHSDKPIDASKPEKFYGAECSVDRHCYNIYGKSLECRNDTCQCIVWHGIELLWSEKAISCIGAGGHPCSSDKMCHSEKCMDSVCLSGGFRSSRSRLSLIQEILIHISVLVIATLVLRRDDL